MRGQIEDMNGRIVHILNAKRARGTFMEDMNECGVHILHARYSRFRNVSVERFDLRLLAPEALEWLLVPKALDGVELGGAAGGVVAKHQANEDGDAHGDRDGARLDGGSEHGPRGPHTGYGP